MTQAFDQKAGHTISIPDRPRIRKAVYMESFEKVLSLIGYGKDSAITGKDLSRLSGADERQIREIISKAREKAVIINDQDGTGYYRPVLPEEASNVLRYARQEESRLESLEKSIKVVRDSVEQIMAWDEC